MIETLNNIQPILIFVMLVIFFSLETFIPYLTHFQSRKKHASRNFVLILLAFSANGACALWLTYWLGFIQKNQIGFLNLLDIPEVASVIVGILLIDLSDYPYHVMTHKISLLWRFHRVHHSDNELDSTSSLRFHPLEPIVQTMWQTMTFALIGVSFASFIIFTSIQIPLLFIQHANIRFPDWIEKPLSYIFVTSSWHKVHHSDEQHYTDSHYSDVFTFWDRMFGTHRKNVSLDQLKWGLKEFKEDKDQTIANQLLLPFKKMR